MKPPKRNLKKRDQEAYYNDHELDEYLLATEGIRAARDEVHEILHGSRKTERDRL